MRKITFSIATIAMLTISANAGKNVAPAPSEPIPVVLPMGLYIGGGLTYAHSKCQCNTNVVFSDGSTSRVHSGTSYGVNLKAGYFLIDNYLAIEGKYIYTPWGDQDKTLKHYGIYLKPSYPITDKFDTYALLGYGQTECETLNDKFKGFSWGLGAEYTFNKKVSNKKDGFGVYVEYLRPLKKTGSRNITVDMVHLGVSYNF